MADRIRLDPDVDEYYTGLSMTTGRSVSSLVNEVLRKVEVDIPKQDKVPVKLDGRVKAKKTDGDGPPRTG